MTTESSQATGPEAQPDEKSIVQLPRGGVALAEVERELVRQAIDRAGGNQTHAAQLLGIERDALRRRLIKYGFHHYRDEAKAAGRQEEQTK